MKAYLNHVNEVWESSGFYERCDSIVKMILAKIDTEMNHYYVPWNPMAYGPQIGINNFKYTRDNLGNMVGVEGTGDKMIWVSPKSMRSTFMLNGLMIDIDGLSLEEVELIINKYLNE